MDQARPEFPPFMLSIIIPTRESERALVRTLAVLVAGAAAGAVREVIVADADSADATAEVADVAGCRIVVSQAPLAARLRDAARLARASWLMFLQPGTVLDATWIDETARFVDDDERRAPTHSRAAVFRPAPAAPSSRPLLIEALVLLRAALGARPRPEQGLVIAKRFYEQIGGHRGNVADPEADLIRRLGRRVVMLRSAAVNLPD
jgi:glycosyltransferase involved in cell wall biosynthesis